MIPASNTHSTRCDVVVVGSGPAGAAVAQVTATAGLHVIVVEEGDPMPKDAPANAFDAMARLYRDLGATVTRGRAPMPYLQGKAVGGTSVVNGAICWRLPRDVYDEWIANDPALASALPWDVVTRAHDEVEDALHIRPTDPNVAGPNNDLLARGAQAMGIEHRPIRRNVRACRGRGRCLQGCPSSKLSVDRTHLSVATAHGAQVMSGVRVVEVLCHRGKAIGVVGLTREGKRIQIMSERVVLAASAIQTPALLWRSRIRHGPVGRHLQCHPGASMTGRFPDAVHVWSGATQGHEGIGLRKDGIKFEALGFDIAVAAMRLKGIGRHLSAGLADLSHWAHWGAAVRARATGTVRPAGRHGVKVRYDLLPGDVGYIRRGLSVLGQMMLAAGAEYVEPGIHGWDARVESMDRMAALETSGPLDARAYPMAITHMFGTCRMGSDPAHAVVRPDFRHHRVRRLYVADSSVFPSNTGVNPMQSIMALASVCGAVIASEA